MKKNPRRLEDAAFHLKDPGFVALLLFQGWETVWK